MSEKSDSILAIDIGGGTQDILFWNPHDRLENSVKLILPSPARVVAKRIRTITEKGRDLYCTGTVMGGGSVTEAVKDHIGKGLKAFAHSPAALTFHDNLDYVKKMGVLLCEEPPANAEKIRFGDIDLESLAIAVQPFGVDIPEHFAVAVQDHGFSPLESNRVVRFRNLSRFLMNGGRLSDRVYEQPPEENSRMWAVKRALPEAMVMDTGTAAIIGALLDGNVANRRKEGLIVINLGNAHTLAAVVSEDRALALYEHHTGCLNPQKLHDHVTRFFQGKLTHREVYEDQGHGVAYAPHFKPYREMPPVVVTGPQRALARDLPCHMAVPFGDMMLSGCFGLIEGTRIKRNISFPINP